MRIAVWIFKKRIEMKNIKSIVFHPYEQMDITDTNSEVITLPTKCLAYIQEDIK